VLHHSAHEYAEAGSIPAARLAAMVMKNARRMRVLLRFRELDEEHKSKSFGRQQFQASAADIPAAGVYGLRGGAFIPPASSADCRPAAVMSSVGRPQQIGRTRLLNFNSS
jgi:hypothetical protein